MNINHKKEIVTLSLIVIFGAGLRFYHLGTLPLSLHNDEVMNGYVGRFTLQNRVDLYGNRLPWRYFDNFGDYPNIIPMYLSGLATYILGVNALAIRFPVALAGTLSIVLIYLIAQELFQKTKIPLAADESIRSLKDAYDFISRKAVSVIILKPMMLGGIIPALKIIQFAQENKIKVVVTTSLDSCIGRSFAVLAASFVEQETAHGLGTAELFEKDLFPDPYTVKNGQIHLS